MTAIVCRGVRGATTVESDTEAAILEATTELLDRLVSDNGIDPADVVSVFFTTTPDLTAAFPAKAAHRLGWESIALLGAQEMPVKTGLERCVRVLIHWNTTKPQDKVRHAYLRGATVLRSDRVDSAT